MLNGCTILVVEEDGENRELMVELLESQGYAATGVENGLRALDALEAGLNPDLIITDLQMPVMTGWELCEHLSSHPRLQAVPIVLVCGELVEPSRPLKVAAVFQKPTEPARLLARIAELCGL